MLNSFYIVLAAGVIWVLNQSKKDFNFTNSSGQEIEAASTGCIGPHQSPNFAEVLCCTLTSVCK